MATARIPGFLELATGDAFVPVDALRSVDPGTRSVELTDGRLLRVKHRASTLALVRDYVKTACAAREAVAKAAGKKGGK